MKKFVSFCVAVAFAVSAVPAMAQCSSCGSSAPVFSQPVMSTTYAPQATYSAPMMGQPIYSAPVMNQPVYSAPMMSAPIVTSAPVVSGGCGGCGVTSAPVVMSSAPVAMSCAPMVSSCGGCGVVSAPVVSSGCGGCGGAMMSGTVIWQGGAPMQGTIVSDVVVEGGAATSDKGVEGTVDVVEPPVAVEESEAPAPDSEEEEDTEGET